MTAKETVKQYREKLLKKINWPGWWDDEDVEEVVNQFAKEQLESCIKSAKGYKREYEKRGDSLQLIGIDNIIEVIENHIKELE